MDYTYTVDRISYVYNELSYRFPYLYDELDYEILEGFILKLDLKSQTKTQYSSKYIIRRNIFIEQFYDELECTRYLIDKHIYTMDEQNIKLVDLLLHNHKYYASSDVSIFCNCIT
ncbi:hypothetical protein CCP3SC1AL1_630009 [Gammaproteobacteria bacterium]